LSDTGELLPRMEGDASREQPYRICMADESLFFIGGMWEVWRAREPEALFTFTVLTTFPNEVSGIVHDRVPVIVQPKDYQRWLDPDKGDVADILAPYPIFRDGCLPG
jgi:putative SOS response-associated peptidase YedK